jgi:spore coat protein A
VAPAERFDLIVDFSRYRIGQAVNLVNRLGTGTTRHIMQFRVARGGTDESHVPARLATLETLHPAQAQHTRTFTFRNGNGNDHSWTVNGRTFDPGRADATPKLGDVEIWRFNTDFHHPIHLHLVHFKVLQRNMEAPGPYDGGWKDTIDLRPAEQVAVIARFTDYPGRFIYHCHNLEHEDMAMMANMQVT